MKNNILFSICIGVMILLGTDVHTQTHATLLNADDLWAAPWNLHGENRMVGVFEVGGYANVAHTEFATKRAVKHVGGMAAGVSDHATSVTSVLISRGLWPSAKGIAYKGTARSYYFKGKSEEARLFASLFDQEHWAVTNHSYSIHYGWDYSADSSMWFYFGFRPSALVDPFGAYLDQSRIMDSVVYASNYVVPVVAAGNVRGDGPKLGDSVRFYIPGVASTKSTYKNTDPPINGGLLGYDCLSDRAVAKNVLTVGSVNGFGVLSDFSQTGPTNDGRIKPDLVALGENVHMAGDDSDPNGYQIANGTSFASPGVAAVVMQLQQLFTRYYTVEMLPSTAKALLIHTARDRGNTGPDYQYGWGLVDALAAARLLEKSYNDDEFSVNEFRLKQNVNQYFYVKAESANSPIRITIAWTDPPASVTEGGATYNTYKSDANPKLVNDINMWIDRKENNIITEIYRPWVLDPTKPFASATHGTNNRDNVEQVVIENPDPTAIYRVAIVGPVLIANGEQLFSRCISGAKLYLPPPTTVTASPTTEVEKRGDATEAFSAQVAWTRVSEAGTYTLRHRVKGTIPWTTKTGITNNSFVVTGLELGTYEFQVQARRAAVYSNYKTITKTFAVTPVIPKNLIAGPLAPSSAKLAWTGDANAAGYRVLYVPIDGFGNLKNDGWFTINTTSTATTKFNLTQDTRYAWCVQSAYIDDIKSDFSEVSGFVTSTDCNAYEENNAIDLAKPVDTDRTLYSRACKDDKSDWYSFTITPERRNVRVILYQQPIALKMSLYRKVNGSAQLILESPDNADGLLTKYLTQNNLAAGTYYLRVYNDFPSSSYSNSTPYPFAVNTKATAY